MVKSTLVLEDRQQSKVDLLNEVYAERKNSWSETELRAVYWRQGGEVGSAWSSRYIRMLLLRRFNLVSTMAQMPAFPGGHQIYARTAQHSPPGVPSHFHWSAKGFIGGVQCTVHTEAVSTH